MTVSHKQSLEAGSRSLGLKCVLYVSAESEDIDASVEAAG